MAAKKSGKVVELVKVPAPKRSAKNAHGVPKKQWNRWSDHAREVFNAVFEAMADQSLFIHPDTKPTTSERWRTTRWNAAWIAADAADESR